MGGRLESIKLTLDGYRVYTIIVGTLKTKGVKEEIQLIMDTFTSGPKDEDGEYTWNIIIETEAAISTLFTASHKIASKLPGEVEKVTVGRKTPLHIYSHDNFVITLAKRLEDGRIYYVSLGLTYKVEMTENYDERESVTYWVEVAARANYNLNIEELATIAAKILVKGMES